MRDSIREYARIGLVHHMLYPDCGQHPMEHVESLKELAARTDIDTLDCCMPYDPAARAELIPALRECGKRDITFAAHFFPLRKLSFCTPVIPEQAQVRMVVQDMVECAASVGASGFIFGSGGPAPDDAGPEHYEAFAEFCRWFCAALKRHSITALLEPFDMTIDKCFLYGSTADCAALIESLRPEVDNLAIELDAAHLPLMKEDFTQAVRNVAPYLKRVHLGNCVLKDTTHPRYGDTHPPIGFPGGEIGVPETAQFLRALLDAGFLSRENPGNLVVETTPWPGMSVDETILDSFRRLDEAWRMV